MSEFVRRLGCSSGAHVYVPHAMIAAVVNQREETFSFRRNSDCDGPF